MHIKKLNAAVLLSGSFFLILACGIDDSRQGSSPAGKKKLAVINSQDEFNRIINAARDRLLMFDFYADWCLPCRELEPILESIAWEKREVADIYRINLDQNQSLAQFFNVRGIPHVAFVKNQILVYSLVGLHPKENYLSAIRSFTHHTAGGTVSAESIQQNLTGSPPTQAPEKGG